MLLALKFWGLGVQTLNPAGFYSHKKQVLDLAGAGEIILFYHPHPQSHRAPLKKPEASSLRPPAWIWADPFSGRGGAGWDPSMWGSADFQYCWRWFSPEPCAGGPRWLPPQPRASPIRLQMIVRESQICDFHPRRAVTHPLPTPRSSRMT